MEKLERYRRQLLPVVGVAGCIFLAAILIISVRGTHRSLIVPVVFIVFIILCARYFGMLAGVIVSVVSSLLFAVFLYEPYGSVYIHDHNAMYNVILLFFAGIALSYANAGGEDEPKPRKHL